MLATALRHTSLLVDQMLRNAIDLAERLRAERYEPALPCSLHSGGDSRGPRQSSVVTAHPVVGVMRLDRVCADSSP